MPVTVNVRTGEVTGSWPKLRRKVRAAASAPAGPPDVTADAQAVLRELHNAQAQAPAYPAEWLPGVQQQPHNVLTAQSAQEYVDALEPPSQNGHRPDATEDELYPAHWITGADGEIVSGGGGEGFIN